MAVGMRLGPGSRRSKNPRINARHSSRVAPELFGEASSADVSTPPKLHSHISWFDE